MNKTVLPIAIAAAIGLGVGIDYGIYLLSRICEEYQATPGQWDDAIRRSLVTTGHAIAFTAMIMAIILAAYFLYFVITGIGLTGRVNNLITSLGLSPYALLAVVVVFYLILGMFMETLSMMVATVPIVTPVVIAAGFEPVWFGVVIMLLMELAMITPPVGINLYVIQSIRSSGSIGDVIVGASPFVVAIFLMIGAMMLVPEISLYLPTLFYR